MHFIIIFFINFVIVKSWLFYEHQIRDIGGPCLTATTNENGICKLINDCSYNTFRNPFYRQSYCGYYHATPVVCCPTTRRINDSCFNSKKNFNGKCKLENDCETYQELNFQEYELCGYLGNLPVVCCSEQTPTVSVQTKSIIGESCIVNTTSEKGSCKLVEDCELVLDAKSNLCGTWNSQSIVCCPSEMEVVIENREQFGKLTSNSDYEELPKECITPTGEKGVHKLLKHCQSVQKDEQPIMCEEEFCRDIVCCPIDESSHRKRLTCPRRDDPSEIIINRLSYHNNLTCVTKDTNRSGFIKKILNCLNYDYKNENNYPKLCKFQFCKEYTCCENPINDNDCQYDDRKYESIRLIGDSCTDGKTGLSGTCSLIQQCHEVSERKIEDRTLCGYNCCTDVVCCPERSIGSMCSRYSQSLYQKTERFTNILPAPDQSKQCLIPFNPAAPASFGVLANIREFPFMAALGYETPETKWLCGGTLISEQFVMTAGHCARSPDFGPVKYVRLGIYSLNITESGRDCPEEYQVSEIIPHPNYNVSSRYNDIALLRLNGNVTLNLHILPACLPVDSQIPERLTAMGWGATGYYAPLSDKLIKVDLTLYSKEECSEAYKEGETGRLSRGILEETQMCAGSRTDGQDTCVGDSGGPIQTKHIYLGGMATVHGITSFGRACGFKNNPSVYTKVFPYVKWIESIVWP